MMLLNGGVLGMLHGELPRSLRPGADSWRIATLFIACAVFLFIVQEMYPTMVWIRIPGNALMTLGVSVYGRALRQFYGLPDARLVLLAPAIATLVGVWWFVAVQPSLVGRIGVSTLFWLVALLDALRTLLAQRADAAVSRRVMVGVFGLVTLFAAGRLGWFMVSPDPGASVFESGRMINALSPLVLSILPVIGTTVFLMMCSERIRGFWEDAASIDYLTGLPNRRTLAVEGEGRLASARAENGQLALALVDLDHFKRINDRFGHAAGDEALIQLAALLRQGARPGDLIVRQGGEEFVFVLVGLGREAALERMQRLRESVANHAFYFAGQRVPVTVSIGVTWLDGCDANFAQMIRDADNALYCAKEGGRNRVETSERAAGCECHAAQRFEPPSRI